VKAEALVAGVTDSPRDPARVGEALPASPTSFALVSDYPQTALAPALRRRAGITGLGLGVLALALAIAVGLLILTGPFHTSLGSVL